MSTLTQKKTTKTKIAWDEALDLYETHLRARRAAERTVVGYLIEVRYLRDWLAKTTPKAEPADVTLDLLRDYQCGLLTGASSRTGKKLAASTVSRTTTMLASFFGFLADEERIERDPTRRLERPRVAQRAPGRVLTVKEVQRVLGAADVTTPLGLRDRAVVETLYATGLRRAEVLALDLSDLDHEEREVTVQHGKGDKGRVVPLTRSAYEKVKDYLDRARPVLVKRHDDGHRALFLTLRGRRQERVGLALTLKRLSLAAGLKRLVALHDLRRSFATHLHRGGASLRHIQALLAHADLNTTAVYLRVGAQELRREVLLRHPRERMDP